jgi:WhiB family redox-sensing transcriptional regulator
MTRYAGEWRTAGSCLAADPELFFPITSAAMAPEQVAEALRICGRCQVREQCLEFAMDNSETHGIWGGTTPEERTRDRRRRAARRRRLAAVG